jgi:hypothetical protein
MYCVPCNHFELKKKKNHSCHFSVGDQTSRETIRPKQEINPTTKISTEKCCIAALEIV